MGAGALKEAGSVVRVGGGISSCFLGCESSEGWGEVRCGWSGASLNRRIGGMMDGFSKKNRK